MRKRNTNRPFIDLTGKCFGRLKVAERVWSEKDARHVWRCVCVCGNEKLAQTADLVSGKISSCGCLHREILVTRNFKHGLKQHPLYVTWHDMKRRCYEKSNPAYKRYGGRGIVMCDEWKASPKAFIEWAEANGYSKGLSIDRIDNNGNYEPSNCRWTTVDVQSRNKSTNIFITYRGETKVLQDWAEQLNIDHMSLKRRIEKHGIEGAFNYKIRKPLLVECRGKVQTVAAWAKEVGMGPMTLHYRLKRHPPEVAIFTPVGAPLGRHGEDA